MSAPVGAPAATALPALRDPGTTGSAKLPAIHSAHGRQLPALSHPGHGLAAPLQPERDDGTAREVEKSTAAAAGAGPHSNSNTTTGADAGAARAAPWEQRPLGSHSAASSTSASTTAAASSDAAAAAAAPKNTTAETPEERKEPPHGTDDASGDIILPSGTAQVVDSASEAGDSDSDNAGAGDDEAKDTTGDELTARPSHQAVPPALLKRFSSQCLRASVWPSCLDLTPRGGFSALGQGQRVLNDVLVSKRLRVRCCAWNLHAKSPPDDLSTLFPPGKFHLYVIASSECVHSIAASVVMRDKTKWEAAARKTIGPGYTKVRSHVLQAIHLMVFAHDDILPLISGIRSAAVPCGVANTLGNKGGVGVAFNVGATSFLFVSCHLAAHQRHIAQRNADYHRVNNSLQGLLDKQPSTTSTPHSSSSEGQHAPPASDCYDRVVFLGDMNYRINGSRLMIDTLISSRMHEVLLANDQLEREKRRGNVFVGFREGPLNFPPTYKFDKGTDTYDSSAKQRIPAWTDRILYKSTPENGMRLLSYMSLEDIRTSDHRPVVANYEVTISTEPTAPPTTGDVATPAPDASNPTGVATAGDTAGGAAAGPHTGVRRTAPEEFGGHHSQVCSIQ